MEGGKGREPGKEWNWECEPMEKYSSNPELPQDSVTLNGNVISGSTWKWCGDVNCFQMMTLNL